MNSQLESMLAKANRDHAFVLDDLLLVLTILRNDEMLNKYLEKLNDAEDDKNIVDAYWDIGIDVKNLFPDYDSSNVDAIQALMQNTSYMDKPVITFGEPDEGSTDHSFTISSAVIKRLKAIDVDVSVRFEPFDDVGEEEPGCEFNGELYPVVTFEFENFYLEV